MAMSSLKDVELYLAASIRKLQCDHDLRSRTAPEHTTSYPSAMPSPIAGLIIDIFARDRVTDLTPELSLCTHKHTSSSSYILRFFFEFLAISMNDLTVIEILEIRKIVWILSCG